MQLGMWDGGTVAEREPNPMIMICYTNFGSFNSGPPWRNFADLYHMGVQDLWQKILLTRATCWANPQSRANLPLQTIMNLY